MLGDHQREFYEGRLERLSTELPGFRPEVVRGVIGLAMAHDALVRRINGFLAPYELSTATLNVLIILSERESLPLSELSQLLVKTAANVTGLIDGLVKRNLVLRQAHEQDRRVKLVSLTSEGRELIDSLFPKYHTLVSRIFGALEPAELESLTGSLFRLTRSAEDEAPL